MSLAPLDVRRDGDVVVAALRGDIDMSVAVELQTRITAEVPNDAVGLVLDLSAVQYLDSAAIQMLFTLARDLGACRQHVGLAVPEASPVRKLMKIANVTVVMELQATAAEAVAAIASRAG